VLFVQLRCICNLTASKREHLGMESLQNVSGACAATDASHAVLYISPSGHKPDDRDRFMAP
jgi:hypothetical protein